MPELQEYGFLTKSEYMLQPKDDSSLEADEKQYLHSLQNKAKQENQMFSQKRHMELKAAISAMLFKIKEAYPAVASKYTRERVENLTTLWEEIFFGVDPVIFCQAVYMHIKFEDTSFFPSPGKITKYIEKIKAENRKARIRNGERCENCGFCEIINGWEFCKNKNVSTGFPQNSCPDNYLCDFYTKRKEHIKIKKDQER